MSWQINSAFPRDVICRSRGIRTCPAYIYITSIHHVFYSNVRSELPDQSFENSSIRWSIGQWIQSFKNADRRFKISCEKFGRVRVCAEKNDCSPVPGQRRRKTTRYRKSSFRRQHTYMCHCCYPQMIGFFPLVRCLNMKAREKISYPNKNWPWKRWKMPGSVTWSWRSDHDLSHGICSTYMVADYFEKNVDFKFILDYILEKVSRFLI